MVDLCPISRGRSYCGPVNILKHTFSQTIGLIEVKFHVKNPYDKLAKIYAKYFGHMTKMSTTATYGKNLSPEPEGQ